MLFSKKLLKIYGINCTIVLLQLYEGGRKMSGLSILVWIFVIGIIIGGLIVFFKNKKEKEDLKKRNSKIFRTFP